MALREHGKPCFPAPPPEKATYETDPRIDKADKLMRQWNRVTPSVAAVHEFNGTIPAECVQFMVFGFTTIWFCLLGQIPSYVDYMARADWVAAYRYHTRILKLLQWKNPRRRWVLKSPEHLRFMPVISTVYPDAGFIWTHRDPVIAVASANNFSGTLNWVRSDHPFRHEVFAHFNKPEFAAMGLETPIDWLQNGVLSERRLCNILYADFVRDPLGSVEQIYHQFDIDLTNEIRVAMKRYIHEQPRTARPRHEYEKGSSELIASEREIFKRYQTYFNVPNEI